MGPWPMMRWNDHCDFFTQNPFLFVLFLNRRYACTMHTHLCKPSKNIPQNTQKEKKKKS